MRRRRWIPVIFVPPLLAGIMIGQTAGAGAAAGDLPPYLAATTDPAAQTLAADLNIPLDEARRRIGWQEPALRLGAELEQRLGERYGGLWIDEAGGGRVKVGVVGSAPDAAALIAARHLTAVTDLVPVRRSYAQLQRDHAWLSAAITKVNPHAKDGQFRGLASSLILDRNQVQLEVPQDQPLSSAQRALVNSAAQKLAGSLKLGSWSGRSRTEACAWDEVYPTWQCDPPLRGGVGLDASISNATRLCTAGFNVRSNSDAKWYVLTAGHCSGNGAYWYSEPHTLPPNSWDVGVGIMHRSVYPGASGNEDYGIIENVDQNSYWRPGPYVYVHRSADTTENATYGIIGTSGSTPGMRVCISGAVSGTDCGAVTATGWPVAGGYAVADYCSQGGDSGGPVYSSNYARGIHHGSKTGAAACKDRLYQGIAEAINTLNVYVVHT